MVDFITMVVIDHAGISLEAGKAKYEQYFKNSFYRKKYKAEVDAKLTEAGYGEVIVEL